MWKRHKNINPQRTEKPDDLKKVSNRQSTYENMCKIGINITRIFFDKLKENVIFEYSSDALA